MQTKTIISPITLLYEGQYVPPGTSVTLPIDEANAIIKRFGAMDEDSEVTLSNADLASIEALNLNHAIFNS